MGELRHDLAMRSSHSCSRSRSCTLRAVVASDLAGRPVRRVVVPDAEYRAGQTAHGVPEAAAGLLMGMFAAGRHGESARVGPALARLIGRPAMPVRDVLKAAISPAG